MPSSTLPSNSNRVLSLFVTRIAKLHHPPFSSFGDKIHTPISYKGHINLILTRNGKKSMLILAEALLVWYNEMSIKYRENDRYPSQ